MPYKSRKQQAYFNIHRKELEGQGVDVDEWNASTKGKDLPEKAPMKKSAALLLAAVLVKNLEKRAALQQPFQPPVPLNAQAGAQMASNVSLNPTPTNPASAPNTPATPAAETGKVPPSKPMNAPTGNADGAPITDDETGSVLMPPQ
jgi:hypothetical protein